MGIGMTGLGRMGANVVRRLLRAVHECVLWNRSPGPVQALAGEGAVGASPVLTVALFQHFRSRGEGDFASSVLSALCFEFDGHHEKPQDA
jgi:6-phosphogluconate dehydrogenase (decarboxylating)